MIRRRVVPVVLLAIGTAVLGAWGYSEVSGLGGSATDTAYRTLQLYGVQGEIPAAGTPWQLDVARFLGPATVAYAVVVAVLAVARDQVQRARTRLTARGHVLIIGTGGRGSQLARSLRGTHDVVGLEIDPTGGTARSLRESGVPVLAGDARDPDTLRVVRAERAAHVVVLTGDDSTNLEILAALRKVVPADHPVPIHVAIESPGLWAELHRLPMQTVRAQRRVEFVSIPDRLARLLVDAAAGGGAGLGCERVVVWGAGPVVARLAVQLLRSPLTAERPELVLNGPDADANMRLLRATEPWAFERAAVRAGDAAELGGAALAFVCGLGEAEALEAAVTLAGCIDPAGKVRVAVADSDLEVALGGAGVDRSRIELVPTGARLMGADLLEGAAHERIARGKHADYLFQQSARGDSSADNDALRPWDELDESYRQSNRRFADGVAAVLARLDAELVPLAGREVGGLPVAPEVLEELAQVEHDRWCRDQQLDGWRPTDGPKDPARKLHPMLRPWEELDEGEREKDRDAMRALPQLFASMGYELVVPHGAPEPPSGGRRTT